jgi:lysozyme
MTTEYLIPDLIADEGLRLNSYQDTRGNWTIGVGHLLGVGNWSGIRWDNKQVLDQLKKDIGTTEEALDMKLPWWKQLSDIRQDVMVNLAFNLGTSKLSTWKHTLGDIMTGRFEAAGIDLEHDEPWASQVHDRAFRLALQMQTNMHQPR